MRIIRSARAWRSGAIGLVSVALLAACSSAAGSPKVTGTVPGRVAPGQRAFVLIEGDHFARGATARVGQQTLDAVTWINERVLTGEVPSGLAPGSYDVTVDNPGGGHTTLPQAFTVGNAAAASQAPAPATGQAATGVASSAAGTAARSATTGPAALTPPATEAPATRTPTRAPATRTVSATTAASTAAASQSMLDVSGEWSMVDTVTYGVGTGSQIPFQFTIQQNGTAISGSGSGLRFSGTFDGSTIQVNYVQAGGLNGVFTWTVSGDGNSFSGTFTNSTGNGGTSTGQKIGGAVALAQPSPTAPPARYNQSETGRAKPPSPGRKKDR